ncbi:L-2-hydroxyglutarate dehydrogenase, mitochondrial isoform X2 [Nymphaea colorata]|uniref:L-2-hydroxyglutarate dehydrogenase, mitochondrial isoform X2 n=1 Tax=Nymphaea colorata TaxID=210225 RepID=UPI00129D94AF|nr:L-2-hydroxyglutarate dehydrogenase, mitochondrial isoform X2 [Nymphaea colorata]
MLKSVFCKLRDSVAKKSIEIGKSCRRFAASNDGIPRERTDCVVIGAGVVGLAVARALSMAGRDVLVVESASTFGTGSSSRNSEVIHAGIYYPINSLKATFCVRGREMLYKYCSHHGIPHANIGKLIVATRSSEIPKLTALLNCGVANGVTGLRMMEGSEATLMESELHCVKALWSPCSGIVDSHSLMLSFVGEAEHHGTTFSYNTAVVGGHAGNKNFHLYVVESKDIEGFMNHHLQPQLVLVPDFVVNSAGLSALSVAKRFEGLSHGANLDSSYARGCYFRLSKSMKSPFKHLIYPIPEDGGLGVHVTLDLSGQVKFGPDVEWLNVDETSSFLNKFDYSVDVCRAKRFYPEIRKYYPSLEDDSLEPDYAGIRPKLSGPKQPFVDFLVQGEESHGVPGLVNLFGIESPGLTSCMAIAEYVVSRYIK